VGEAVEGAGERRAGVRRVDDLVDLHEAGGAVGVDVGAHRRGRRVAGGLVAAGDHVGGHQRIHERDLGRRPGVDGVDAAVVAPEAEVGQPVRLAQHGGELGRLAQRQRGLQADRVLEHPVVLDLPADEEPRHVLEEQHRDVIGVGEAQELDGLLARVRVQRAGEELRLAGHDADDVAVEAAEAADQPAAVAGAELQQGAVVEDATQDLVDVVGARAATRDDGLEVRIGRDRPPVVVLARARRPLVGVGGQERERAADHVVGLVVVLGDEVDLAGAPGVDVGAAELVVGEVLAGGDLGDQRRRDGQARAADLDDEV
jgi:hypothetical protein